MAFSLGKTPIGAVPPRYTHRENALPFARHGEIEIFLRQLFGQQDDLPCVVIHMAHHFEDGFEDRAVTPRAGGLRVNHFEQPRRWQRRDHRSRLLERRIEARAGRRGIRRRRQ